MKRLSSTLGWIAVAPTLWLLACTLTAGWQKIFAGDPKIGFIAHASKFGTAHDAGIEAGKEAGQYLGQSLRQMVGLPEYDTYLAHLERAHPDQTPMRYEAFFRERQETRYGGKRATCC
jgi:uncharacterized short protein YbdD (DUF466 family)